MGTHVWDVRNYVDDLSTYPQIDAIIQGFKAGEVIAIPTETVYGLAADATSEKAVQQIFKAKGRPGDNPLIVHIYDTQQLDFIETIPDEAKRLMDEFWPGPISFILKLKPGYIADGVTAGHETLAVRMPSDPVARALLKLTRLPLAAPSANTSGRPSPTKFEHVEEDLGGKIYGIVRSSQSDVGLESTVLDCTVYPFKIARPGAITASMLERVVPGCIQQADYDAEKPIAPGMKYRHYAPKSPLHIIAPLATAQHFDDHVAVIAPKTMQPYVQNAQFYELCADEADIETAMNRLYDILRTIDQQPHIRTIYFIKFKDSEASAALMNRVEKAAKGK